MTSGQREQRVNANDNSLAWPSVQSNEQVGDKKSYSWAKFVKFHKQTQQQANSNQQNSQDSVNNKTNTKNSIGQLVRKIDDAATPKTVVNFTAIIVISFVCFQQCQLQISEYLKYNHRNQVSYARSETSFTILPSITICNNNRLKLDFLIERGYLKLSDQVKNALYEETVLLNSTNEQHMDTVKQIRRLIDEQMNVSLYLQNSSVESLAKMAETNIIEDVDCAQFGDASQFNCANIPVYSSFQGGSCQSLFYVGGLMEALTTRTLFDFTNKSTNSAFKSHSTKDYFEEKEMAEVIINLDNNQHADFSQDIDTKVVIHSANHIGSVRELSYSLLPGFRYEFFLIKRIQKRLPAPYKSNCRDYKKINSHMFTKNIGTYPSVELDRKVCLRNCITRKALRRCNCWPPEAPFYMNDPLFKEANNAKVCSWGAQSVNDDANASLSSSDYDKCYKAFYVECKENCPLSCSTEDFSIKMFKTRWPSQEAIENAKCDKSKAYLERLRRTHSKISIKYETLLTEQYVMYPTLTLTNLVANMGGIVSALVGVSAVTIYRYFTRKVLGCAYINTRAEVIEYSM